MPVQRSAAGAGGAGRYNSLVSRQTGGAGVPGHLSALGGATGRANWLWWPGSVVAGKPGHLAGPVGAGAKARRATLLWNQTFEKSAAENRH